MNSSEYDGHTLPEATDTLASVEADPDAERRARIREALAPLQIELDELEARKTELRVQIAEIEDEARLLRQVLRPVMVDEPKPTGPKFSTTEQRKPNGGTNGINPETEAGVLAAISKLGTNDAEFTVKQVTEEAGLHRQTTNKVMQDLRDQGRIRLSSVRYPDGAPKVGRESPHYKVVN